MSRHLRHSCLLLRASRLTPLPSLSHPSKDLSVSSWQPPLLSPEDVKLAASSWKEVESTTLALQASVKLHVKTLLEHTVQGSFVPKDEGERMLRAFNAGAVAGLEGAEGSPVGLGVGGAEGGMVGGAGMPLPQRPMTTMGWRG